MHHNFRWTPARVILNFFICLEHSKLKALYLLSSERFIILKSVAHRTATRPRKIGPKSAFLALSVDKFWKNSYQAILDQKLIALSQMSIYWLYWEAEKCQKTNFLGKKSTALWQFCTQPISLICTILDSGDKGLSILNVPAGSVKIQLTLLSIDEITFNGTEKTR